MSKTKGVVKLVVNTDTDPTPQEPSLVENETSGIFVHSTNSSVASRLWFSQGTSLSSSFSKLEFDTDIGLKIHTENPVNVVHDASIRFGTRGSERWKIEGLNGSSGDLLPATNNSLKIGRSGFNLNSVFSRQLISDDTLALAASGATKWNIDSSGHFVPTATTQNIGSSGSYLSFVYANQLLAGTGQALYLGSNAGTYKWYIANSSNAALVPNTAGAFDLGTSSNRVGTLYSTNINNSGSLTTGTIDSGSGVITDVIQTRTTASSLSIKTGTSYPTRVTIDSSGNVGIGTTSPSVLLDLASSDPQIKLSRPSIPSGTVDARLATGNDVGIFGTYSNHSIILTTNGTEKLRILQNGRVGINNIAPTRQLDINGDFRTSSSGAGDLSITHTNVGGNLISNVLSASGVALSLGADGSEAIRVNTSNKVGIGVSSPVARLHVADNFQIGSSATATNNWHFASETGDGKLHFYNGNYGAGTLRATMTSAGNLGIGTSTPSGILHLNKSSGAADIYLGVGGTATGILYSSSSDTTIGSISASPLVFLTGNTEKARIASDGSFGIGVSTPTVPLHVASSSTLASGTPSFVFQGSSNTERLAVRSIISGTSVFIAQNARGTIASPTALLSGDETGGYQFGGYNGSIWHRGAMINGVAAENYTSTAMGTHINFMTCPIGSVTLTERMRISSAGNVGIGNTNPLYLLDCPGVSRIGNNLIDYGSIEINSQGSGDRDAFIDFWAANSLSDYSFRMWRKPGTNGDAFFVNRGLGKMLFTLEENTNPQSLEFIASSPSATGYYMIKYNPAGTDRTLRILRQASGSDSFNEGISIVNGGIPSTGGCGIYLVNDGSIELANEKFSASGYGAYATPGGNFAPIIDSNASCGTSTNRWTAIWSVDGSINTSDYRLKNNITNCNLGLDFIKELRPVYYKWNSSENIKSKNTESTERTTISKPGIRNHYGLIAQEVKCALEKVGVDDFAGWILTDKDNPESDQALRYHEFIAPLIKAVQELSDQVSELKAELTELKNK